MQRPARVLPLGLAGLGVAVHIAPAPHDALDMCGGASAAHPQQPRFRLRRGDAGQGADLGVRELPAGEGSREARQGVQGARHTNAFAGRARVEAHAPAQPGGAGAETAVPAAAGVELPDQGEEASGGGLEVRGQLGDLVPEAVQLQDARRGGDDAWRMRFHGERPLC
jgi:hypothetical protein